MQIHLKNGRSTWKQEWKDIAGKKIFFRSRWEYRYALYLQFLKEHNEISDWLYEPKVFYFEGVKRGTTNYKPDFLAIWNNGTEEYVEIKGYETPKDRTKWKRMAKYFPDVRLRVIKGDWFKSNNKILKGLVKNWE